MNDSFCSCSRAEKLQKSQTKFHDYLKQPQRNSFFTAPNSEVCVTEAVERLNNANLGPTEYQTESCLYQLSISKSPYHTSLTYP